jgi:NAD(P)-dependent dehydrogenase (short-subunit alcohol dehydrogenase family)
MKHVVPLMKAAGKGAIVATSSVAGAIGFPGMAPYVASKHAVFGLAKTAAIELGPANIRVNAVAPGPIDNRMMQSLGDQLGGADPKGFRTSLEHMVPMGRYGKNAEIAHLIAFLASDAASYCTGGLYLADGGYVAG